MVVKIKKRECRWQVERAKTSLTRTEYFYISLTFYPFLINSAR